MPIIQTSSSFTEFPFGNVTSFLKSNNGDRQRATFEFEESISVNSNLGNTIERDAFTNVITWIGGDFEDEGFRAGDNIQIDIYEIATGTITSTQNTSVVWVNEGEMKVASLTSNWYGVGGAVYISNTRNREGLELYFNMVSNGSAGSIFSLIDGEPVRFQIDLQNPSVPVINQIGNKSGAYEMDIQMGLLSQSGGVITYILRIEFITSGLYNENLFDFGNCLKPYIEFHWSSLIGEPFSQTQSSINDNADTGGFNQAYNTGVIDSVLVQGISILNYDSVTSGQFVIDSTSSQYAQGSAYISSDETYYKSQTNDQSELTMIIPSDEVVLVNTARTSSINPDGASYDFKITNVSQLGNIYTIDFEMTPNVAFSSFMESRADGDRFFKVWMKWGSVNVLVFNGQLSKAPAVTQNLNLIHADYFDHSENITTLPAVSVSGFSGNVEDDFAFVGAFALTDDQITTFVRIGIQAFNYVTEEFFTLEQTNFSLVGIPQINGEYVLNLTAPVISSLPDTSVKRVAKLENDNSVITPPQFYGVKVYYPYLYRWEYWLSLASANADFYPDDQTKNWVPYGSQGDWRLRLNLEVDRNENLFQYRDEIGIMNYDSNPNISQEIQLWRDNPLTQVQVIIEGELMRIVALHTNIDGSSWNPDDVWGMITIEPTESSPRWISSTAIDFDGNTLNPLTPLSGLRCDLTLPSPDVVRLECYLDSSKINLTNGVKITSKIKGCTDGEAMKLTSFGLPKVTSSDEIKLKS